MEWKQTHGMRLVVDISEIFKAIPEDVMRRSHILLHESNAVAICDIVSDEPFEVFGEHSMISHKGQPLVWVSVPLRAEK